MDLEQRLGRCAKGLREGRFANEQSISQGVVLPVLSELRWDVFDTTVVWPEFATGEGRVDFALCDPPHKPKCFIEVKQPGKAEDGVRQALEYAFHTGVPFVVLTDGVSWSFYLPAEQGTYEDRRVFKLDVLERSDAESAEILVRYLLHDRVVSGAALEIARKEYRSKSRREIAKQAIPDAWQDLVGKGDDLLIDLIAEAVESKAGVRPADNDVADFLGELSSTRVLSNTPSSNASPHSPGPVRPDTARPKHHSAHPKGTLLVHGESISYASGKDALVKVLSRLAQDDPTFLERCSHHRAFKGRKRRHIARRLDELYPERPDLQETHREALPGGWFLGTNLNNRSKLALIEAAAEVSGLVFGSDIVAEF